MNILYYFFFLIVCSFCSDICFIQIAVLGGRNLLVYSNKKYNKYIYIYIHIPLIRKYLAWTSRNIWGEILILLGDEDLLQSPSPKQVEIYF